MLGLQVNTRGRGTHIPSRHVLSKNQVRDIDACRSKSLTTTQDNARSFNAHHQLDDRYTCHFGCVGTRATGNGPGCYRVASPLLSKVTVCNPTAPPDDYLSTVHSNDKLNSTRSAIPKLAEMLMRERSP